MLLVAWPVGGPVDRGQHPVPTLSQYGRQSGGYLLSIYWLLLAMRAAGWPIVATFAMTHNIFPAYWESHHWADFRPYLSKSILSLSCSGQVGGAAFPA